MKHTDKDGQHRPMCTSVRLQGDGRYVPLEGWV